MLKIHETIIIINLVTNLLGNLCTLNRYRKDEIFAFVLLVTGLLSNKLKDTKSAH